MRLSGNIIKSLLLSALSTALLLAATGCIREDFPTDCPEPKDVVLQISVNAGAPLATKATVAPEDYEAEIHSLRIYAFTQNLLVGHFDSKTDGMISNNNGVVNFFMHVEAHTTSLQQVDFYVIANEEGLKGTTFTENMTKAQLEGLTFSSIAGASNPTEMEMPNVAKATYTLDMSDEESEIINEGEHKDHMKVDAIYPGAYTTVPTDVTPVNSITFNLERPTAKLRVFAASLDNSATSKLTILSAALVNNQAPARGYVMPHTEAELKDHEYETINRVEMELSSAATTTGCVYFDKSASDCTEETKYTEVLSRAYYPHEIPYGSEGSADAWKSPTYYDNDGNIVAAGGTAKGNVLEIVYSFDGGTTTRTGTVYLPPLRRNHYYAVYCLMNNAGQFTIEYRVVAWNHNASDHEWNDLNFEYPAYSPLFPYEATSLEDAHTSGLFTNPECSTGNRDSSGDQFAGCFVAKFLFRGPSGIELTPTLLDAPSTFSIKVYKSNDMSNPLPDNKITEPDSDNPYVLVVGPPEAPDYNTTSVSLGISWFPSWDPNTSFLLLINQGSGDERLWPGSGDETNKIEIDYSVGGGTVM